MNKEHTVGNNEAACLIQHLLANKLIKIITEDFTRTLLLSLWGRAEIIEIKVFSELSFMISLFPLQLPEY